MWPSYAKKNEGVLSCIIFTNLNFDWFFFSIIQNCEFINQWKTFYKKQYQGLVYNLNVIHNNKINKDSYVL